MNFASREVAFKLLEQHGVLRHTGRVLTERLRNYELENYLYDSLPGFWTITDWCPFNGRFCKLRDFVPKPHPPMVGEMPAPPETAIPWNVFVAERDAGEGTVHP